MCRYPQRIHSFSVINPKNGCACCAIMFGSAANRCSNARSSPLSRSNSAGGVPPILASHSGTVVTPCGHGSGSQKRQPLHQRTVVTIPDRVCWPVPKGRAQRIAQMTDHLANGHRSHRRWLAGPIDARRRTISAVSCELASVFIAAGYFALAGGTIPFMRKYSTIWP